MKKYEFIKEEIKKYINENNNVPHSLIPSRSHWVKRFNVSDITVRKALTLLCNENCIYSHVGKGFFVSPPKEEFKEIYAVMTAFESDEFNVHSNQLFPKLILYIEKELRKQGFEMLLALHYSIKETEKNVISKIPQKNPDGAIVYYSGIKENEVYYRQLVDQVPKTIFIDRYIEGLNASFVGCENYKTAFMLGDEAKKYTFDKIYIVNPDWVLSSTVTERMKGFVDSNLSNCEVINASLQYGEFCQKLCDYLNEDIRKHKRIGFLTVNSMIADKIYELVHLEGKEYVHFFTFDRMNFDKGDNMEFTFAIQDAELIAKKAVDLLNLIPYNSKIIKLPCKIVTINT